MIANLQLLSFSGRSWIPILIFSFLSPSFAQSVDNPHLILTKQGTYQLTQKGADHFATLALACVHQEYPYKPGDVLRSDIDILPPKSIHPSFYGCFDWHSAVHGHWMLVRLLKLYPDLSKKAEIKQALKQNLSKTNLQIEAAYFKEEGHKSFERTYGWAWLLKLCDELYSWDDPLGKELFQHIHPLALVIEELYTDFFPRQIYPIRTGEHPNTAFGMRLAWDYAQNQQRTELKEAISTAALRYFSEDQRCPGDWEPGGADFLSPCLEEADLMRRILSAEKFISWYDRFLPAIPPSYLTPALVSDRTDGKLVHLDGLNLSRAWCMGGIMRALPSTHPHQAQWLRLSKSHLDASIPNIASGNYEGEHWLASFAVYTLTVSL